ncbi:MAG: ribosome maturation factor RimP [Gammaproteobacteria bacterium]|jgi:ribosome maturation factor RimP|nr:ribosome maturation factor RimP [Gammaproteobacteria bacterium]MBT4492868.1 ribosome maturation factor RimP [Gammaproteobacteria bacterium]
MSDQLTDLIQPVVEGLGCELWGIERLSMGRHSMLKIYIDNEDGVDVEDCARVSRQVSSLLDVEDPVSGEYTLEVSSPGLDRRLFRLDQFEAYAGAEIRIKLKRPYEGKRKFTGRLRGVEGDEVVLGQDGEEVLFPFEAIERANVVPEH